MCGIPPKIFMCLVYYCHIQLHFVSSVVILTQLVSSSVALPAKLVVCSSELRELGMLDIGQ